MTDILDQARAMLDGTAVGLDSIVPTADDRPGGWEEVARSMGANAAFLTWASTGVPALVAEVERLRAQVQAVRALLTLDDGGVREHVTGCEGGPTCPACWSATIRRALDQKEVTDD